MLLGIFFKLAREFELSDIALVGHNSRGWVIAVKGQMRGGMGEKRMIIRVHMVA